jgi:hypothetical protein
VYLAIEQIFGAPKNAVFLDRCGAFRGLNYKQTCQDQDLKIWGFSIPVVSFLLSLELLDTKLTWKTAKTFCHEKGTAMSPCQIVNGHVNSQYILFLPQLNAESIFFPHPSDT